MAQRDTPEARRLDLLHQYDYLGPLTRQAVMDSPKEIVVGQMLAEAPMELLRDSEAGMYWDDAGLAAWLKGKIRSRMGKPAEYYQLEPRRLVNRRGEAVTSPSSSVRQR